MQGNMIQIKIYTSSTIKLLNIEFTWNNIGRMEMYDKSMDPSYLVHRIERTHTHTIAANKTERTLFLQKKTSKTKKKYKKEECEKEKTQSLSFTRIIVLKQQWYSY